MFERGFPLIVTAFLGVVIARLVSGPPVETLLDSRLVVAVLLLTALNAEYLRLHSRARRAERRLGDRRSPRSG